MKSHLELGRILRQIKGRGYGAYLLLRGVFQFPGFMLTFDGIQRDPYAAPSRLSLRLDSSSSGLPSELTNTRVRRVAAADFLTRSFDEVARQVSRPGRGSGNSGLIEIDRCGQEVLERTSVIVDREWLEVRCTVGLPATGRRVMSELAYRMLLHEIPEIAKRALLYGKIDKAALRNHVETVEDQVALRLQLREQKLVAFIANDSLLPRRSGVDDRPAAESDVGGPLVFFQSPPELEVNLHRPNRGPIQGMGMPEGVTLIVGGGFHGKSTLLRALERGVYDHVPGDGREWAVTVDSALKIRAEDGRSIRCVDISPFINHLPYSGTTAEFSTDNASGSTSQAANIVEALELGAQLLLMDEDTSATNFMIRDARMQALVPGDEEPITPLIDRVRQLFDEHGVSTILVMGGSGDYFDAADLAIQMDTYRPLDVTGRMKEILLTYPSLRRSDTRNTFSSSLSRSPAAESFDSRRGKHPVRISAKGPATLLFGRTVVDLAGLEQLVDSSQARAVGYSIYRFAQDYAARKFSLREGLSRLEEELQKNGLDHLSPSKLGNLARPRMLEVGAAVNRMRTLRVT